MYYTFFMKMFTCLNNSYLRRLILTITVGLISSFSILASAELEQKKIDHLLASIEKSGATFERNGDIHKASEARSHLAFKLQRATTSFIFFGSKKEISADEFIEKIASKSSTSGVPYYIITNEGKSELGPWLKTKLLEFKN